MSGCALGAFVNGGHNLADFQARIGRKLAVVLIYSHWLDKFPLDDIISINNNGSRPLLTWEPWVTHQDGTLAAIAAGAYENYVQDFLQAAKAWGKPLLLRFAHEMNGNWYPWDGTHNGAGLKAPVRYKQAWTYIYSVKQKVGADNVSLVWCPNNLDIPAQNWNQLTTYYPGDKYVDWIGLDGYNWGYGGWQSFSEVFDLAYQKLAALNDKPLLIGEFAAAEQGGSKERWISDAFARLESSYPRVKIFCWFNINKERDWRINSSLSAEAAFKKAVGSSYFRESLL